MSTYHQQLLHWEASIRSHFQKAKKMMSEEVRKKLQQDLDQFHTELNARTSIEDETLYEQAMKIYENIHSYHRTKPVPIGAHLLPPLSYPYNALEPFISEQTMRLHHDKHHQRYVDGLNKAEKELQKAREKGDFSLIKHWERETSFHGAGHYLHTIFWDIMHPKGGGKPKDELLYAIEFSFGSFEKMKKQFSQAAVAVEGSGWAILVWSPRSQRLEILQAEKHQNLSQWDVIPILVLDVWEHAYYLQYQNDRKKYIENWWKIVYWPAAQKRYKEAKMVTWQPF